MSYIFQTNIYKHGKSLIPVTNDNILTPNPFNSFYQPEKGKP